ncbi:MAG: hypothetical protein J5903_01775, partial [Clostridia bacterium]|nr:hypothetical protein [Clostridia bacterium]
KMKEGDDSAFDNWFFSISRRGCRNKDGSKWVEKRIGRLMFAHLVCDELSIDDCSSTLVNSFTKSCFDKSPSSTDEEVVSAEQMKVRLMALVKLKKNFQMLKWGNDVLPDYVKVDEFGRLYSDTLFQV